MYTLTTLVMLIGGVALIVSGLSAEQSIASGFSKLFTGAPTDRAIWMLIAGVVLTLLGLTGVLRRSKDTV